MLDFRQKRKIRSFMYSRITLGVLVVLVLIAIRSVFVVYQKKLESENLKQMAESRKSELSARDKEISAEIERLGTESGLESEIRSRYNVAKEKENIVVIVDDNSSSTQATTTSLTVWQKIKNFFKKL
ncbi:MAG: septum formation initiator family protein [bacterium]